MWNSKGSIKEEKNGLILSLVYFNSQKKRRGSEQQAVRSEAELVSKQPSLDLETDITGGRRRIEDKFCTFGIGLYVWASSVQARTYRIKDLESFSFFTIQKAALSRRKGQNTKRLTQTANDLKTNKPVKNRNQHTPIQIKSVYRLIQFIKSN